jgi:hypothetical protein
MTLKKGRREEEVGLDSLPGPSGGRGSKWGSVGGLYDGITREEFAEIGLRFSPFSTALEMRRIRNS